LEVVDLGLALLLIGCSWPDSLASRTRSPGNVPSFPCGIPCEPPAGAPRLNWPAPTAAVHFPLRLASAAKLGKGWLATEILSAAVFPVPVLRKKFVRCEIALR
jgi:hypothetical protein